MVTTEQALHDAQVERAARLAHEVNRAYCRALGDASHAEWDDAPDWQKATVRAGVEAIIRNPDLTPKESHESWRAKKVADGWVYGPAVDGKLKDPDASPPWHSCLLPYSQLPAAQRVKDYLFGAAVRASLGLPQP